MKYRKYAFASEPKILKATVVPIISGALGIVLKKPCKEFRGNWIRKKNWKQFDTGIIGNIEDSLRLLSRLAVTWMTVGNTSYCWWRDSNINIIIACSYEIGLVKILIGIPFRFSDILFTIKSLSLASSFFLKRSRLCSMSGGGHVESLITGK